MLTVAQTGGLSLSTGTGLVALVVPLLLIVPGLVGLRVGLWTARRPHAFTQLETLVGSVLVSLWSLLTFYLVLSVALWRPVTFTDVTNSPLALMVSGYLIHFGVAVVVGVAYGSFAYNYLLESRPRDQHDSWDYAFNHLPSTATVDVKTTSGSWFRGHVMQSGRSSGTRDLLLSSVESLDDASPPLATEESVEIRSIGGSGAEPTEPDGGGEFLDELDELDMEMNKDPEIQAAQRDADSGYLYLDEPDIEVVRFHDIEAVDVDRTLDDKDRIHQRLVALLGEFGLPTTARPVRSVVRRLNGSAVRYGAAVMTIGAISLVAIADRYVFGPTTRDVAGAPVATLVWLGLLAGILIHEVVRYRHGPETVRPRSSELCLVGGAAAVTVIALVALLGSPLRALFIGGLATVGFIVSAPLYSHLCRVRSRYTAQAAWSLAVSSVSVLGVCLSILYLGTLPRPVGQVAFLAIVSALTALFAERVSVGRAEEYQYWSTVLADGVALALALVGSVAFLWAGTALLNFNLVSAGYSLLGGFVGITSLWLVVQHTDNATSE